MSIIIINDFLVGEEEDSSVSLQDRFQSHPSVLLHSRRMEEGTLAASAPVLHLVNNSVRGDDIKNFPWDFEYVVSEVTLEKLSSLSFTEAMSRMPMVR